MKLLVADDDPQMVRALRITLAAHGYEVVAAVDGPGAIAAAAQTHPDIVLLDLGMPHLDGVQVIQALRGWTAIPIIVVSGRTGSADKVEALDDRPARFGPFVTTAIAFFLVEMGDKTQLATVALGARYHNVWAVTAGTTLGMMLANVPAVLLGNTLLRRVPMRLVHGFAALLFLAAGIWMAGETAGWF